MYKILIVEDDFLNRRLIKKVLEENQYTVFDANNYSKALEILNAENIDIAILDINLGADEKDGIELGHHIQNHHDIPIIYLTAYETPEIIKKAITTDPTSYITKPFKTVDMLVSVEIALNNRPVQVNKETSKFLSVKDNDYFKSILIESIDYIVSEGNYLIIHSDKNMYKYRSTIKGIISLLPETDFIQTHRAFIINKNRINKYSHKHVIINGVEIPVSKNYIEHPSALMKND